MFSVSTPGSVTALNLLNLSTIIEPNGPVFNGPGASKPNTPFLLRTLELPEREAIEKAKKYAMEQSIRAVLLRQTQSQQSLQLNNIKKNQTVALLNRVYVGSIAYDVKEESLRQAFLPFGPLKSVSMSWDPATQKHKGFAFLEYEYPEAAQLAIEQMNNASFGGRQLKVGRPSNLANADPIIAELVAEHKLENRIYVSGIHLDLTEDDVSLVFEAFGKILFCKLLPDSARPECHRGFGYIEYQNFQSAADAVASMNQFNLGGQLLRVCKAISPPEGISSATSSTLPPAAAVAAASATAKVLSMETEQLPANTSQSQSPAPQQLLLPMATTSVAAHNGFSSSPSAAVHTAPTQRTTGFGPKAEVPLANAVPQTVIPTIAPEPPGSFEPMNHQELQPQPPISTPSTIPMPPPSEDMHGVSHSDIPMPQPIPGVLVLRNMVGPEDCDEELEVEVASECSKYGSVERVIIHQETDSETNAIIVKVFVRFSLLDSVHNAISALNGRYFAGRQITAEPYDVQAFMENDLSH
ncbi:unnamed protein product [Calicophoron daubneyi]|uniref:RRM domain-containing protein n=1 Tax=Calicophoron daubneyi TaxID=300641 RepID=A0AAV2T7R7_CALDB